MATVVANSPTGAAEGRLEPNLSNGGVTYNFTSPTYPAKFSLSSANPTPNCASDYVVYASHRKFGFPRQLQHYRFQQSICDDRRRHLVLFQAQRLKPFLHTTPLQLVVRSMGRLPSL